MDFDLSIVETGNGGDLRHTGIDFAVVNGIENMPYLAMFGGNPIPDPQNELEKSQNFDWWANNLLMPSDSVIQMISITERTLNTTPLTSSGRVTIENAIKKDLEFLSPVVKIEVSVVIAATDRINISLRIAADIGEPKVLTLIFEKSTDGDFFLLDFNDDFLK
jgi:hypothetical protein